MITISTSLPLDLRQCVSTLIWSNVHLSFISYINDTFSTSPVHSVFIPASSSTGYFRVNCTLLPGGSGCVIKVFNSSGFFIFMEVLTLNDTVTVSDDDYTVVSKTTTHRLTANGTYIVHVYSLKDSDIVGGVVIASSIIEVILPSPSPSLVSTSSPSHTLPPSLSPSLLSSPSQSVTSSPSPSCFTDCSDSNSLGAIIGGVFGGIIGIILIVCFIFCVVCLAKHYNCQRCGQYEVERRPQNDTETLELDTIKNGTFKRSQHESTRAAGEAKSSERPLLNGSQSATDTGPGDDVKSPTSDVNPTILEEQYQTDAHLSAGTGDLQASAPVMKEVTTKASSDDDDKREYTLDKREHDPRPQITERKIQESQAVDHNIEVNPM
ncbi:PREDICTED: uncharacterized protein LOC109590355 [Amphimedon queenslandica]|nr:PREDICTED: uncharacterized protein LOC109590355 [Amphimedon queenslandica]|eukprot:XP_019861837.1 PREDICTED: uncharacterized protein LOC109590355 [Amphimedon queenslandica]